MGAECVCEEEFMKWRDVFILALAAILVFGLACRGRRQGGFYDPAAVTTLKGTVKSFDSVDRNGMTVDQIMLDQGTETVRVSLGPDSYVSRQPVKLTEGDQVSVEASKATMNGKVFFVAASVTKGTEVLKLRDSKTGKPLWPRKAPQG